MREERDDRLTREIIAFQEGPHGHGKVIPPNRESEENGVVLRHLLFCDVDHDLRPDVVILFGLGAVSGLIIVCGVRIFCGYTIKISAGLIGDPVGHAVQMAGPGEVNDKDAVPGRLIALIRGRLRRTRRRCVFRLNRIRRLIGIRINLCILCIVSGASAGCQRQYQNHRKQRSQDLFHISVNSHLHSKSTSSSSSFVNFFAHPPVRTVESAIAL